MDNVIYVDLHRNDDNDVKLLSVVFDIYKEIDGYLQDEAFFHVANIDDKKYGVNIDKMYVGTWNENDELPKSFLEYKEFKNIVELIKKELDVYPAYY